MLLNGLSQQTLDDPERRAVLKADSFRDWIVKEAEQNGPRTGLEPNR